MGTKTQAPVASFWPPNCGGIWLWEAESSGCFLVLWSPLTSNCTACAEVPRKSLSVGHVLAPLLCSPSMFLLKQESPPNVLFCDADLYATLVCIVGTLWRVERESFPASSISSIQTSWTWEVRKKRENRSPKTLWSMLISCHCMSINFAFPFDGP